MSIVLGRTLGLLTRFGYDASVNTGVQTSVQVPAVDSRVCVHPKVELLDHMVIILFLICGGTARLSSTVAAPLAPPNGSEAPVRPHPHHTHCFLLFNRSPPHGRQVVHILMSLPSLPISPTY